jgi:hypothetical protein
LLCVNYTKKTGLSQPLLHRLIHYKVRQLMFSVKRAPEQARGNEIESAV